MTIFFLSTIPLSIYYPPIEDGCFDEIYDHIYNLFEIEITNKDELEDFRIKIRDYSVVENDKYDDLANDLSIWQSLSLIYNNRFITYYKNTVLSWFGLEKDLTICYPYFINDPKSFKDKCVKLFGSYMPYIYIIIILNLWKRKL